MCCAPWFIGNTFFQRIRKRINGICNMVLQPKLNAGQWIWKMRTEQMHTWTQGAKAPGRYHNAIVSPSPRMMVGQLSIPLKEEGCFRRTLLSCSSFVLGCISVRLSDNLIKSMPHATKGEDTERNYNYHGICSLQLWYAWVIVDTTWFIAIVASTSKESRISGGVLLVSMNASLRNWRCIYVAIMSDKK